MHGPPNRITEGVSDGLLLWDTLIHEWGGQQSVEPGTISGQQDTHPDLQPVYEVFVMSVYVDEMKAPFGRMIMCHMWADSEQELLEMVDRIGVQRKWLQQPPKASWVHFDISLGKKQLALSYGAIQTDRYGAAYHVAKLNGNTRMVDMIDGLRSKKAQTATNAL